MRISDWSSDVCSSDLALDAEHRDGVAVVGDDRRERRARLAARMLDEAASVEQDERVADAKPTQIDRTDVAAREIAARLAVAAVERLVAHLRDRAQKIIARARSGRRNLLLAADGYGVGFGALGAGEAAAGGDVLLPPRP